MSRDYTKKILSNLRSLREKLGYSESDLEEKLILGPGWISRIESGETIPSIDELVALAHSVDGTLSDLLIDLPVLKEQPDLDRQISAEQDNNGILVHFRYANFDSTYLLRGATVEEFEEVVKTLRDGLSRLDVSVDSETSKAIKTDSVATAFLRATAIWPDANPSDLWWFVIYRAYCDPYNHPASFARLDLTQSWKRTSGWALEEILVRHYADHLRKNGANIHLATANEKQEIVDSIDVGDRIEADKIDVVIAKTSGEFRGVVHVKASFAERRTDDVPMSSALARAGYISPLWTMDCKSTPASNPKNKGELGNPSNRRSAKRKDIEDEGYFTGCFSYNANTIPSDGSLPADRRIYVCDFRNPDDSFTRFIRQRL